MTIHSEHPFADPNRQSARQFRGRLGGRVSLWTSGPLGTPDAAGLTVSSLLVAAENPGAVIALLGPDSDLYYALIDTGRAVVSLLNDHHRQLAQVFAGLMPAPGGPFTSGSFEPTDWGPRLTDAPTWAGVRFREQVSVGTAMLVICDLDAVHIADDPATPERALHHVRGHYRSWT